MGSYTDEKEINIVKTLTPQTDDSDTLLAMVLGANMVFPAVLNAAIELNLFEIIAKESINGFMSTFEIATKLPAQHSDLPNQLERMLRTLASYNLLSVSTRVIRPERMLRMLASYNLLSVSTRANDDGSTVRVYGITSSGKYFVDDENDGGYLESTSCLSQLVEGKELQNSMRIWVNRPDFLSFMLHVALSPSSE